MSALQVLYEDNHCLVVNKPAGWLSMGDRTGDVTMLDVAKEYIQQKYRKPGAVFLGVVHRLDRPVSGVLLFARTSKAASRLSEQFREHRVDKTYWAVVTGKVPVASGELVQQLVKDSKTNTVRVISSATPGSQNCRLTYRRLHQSGQTTLLEIRPQTGRSHQIRVQLASQGWPIVGDRKYGSQRAWADGEIALHAQCLQFEHPTLRTPIRVECDPDPNWRGC